jgi:hypothetical protein
MALFLYASGATDLFGGFGGDEIRALKFPEHQETLFAIVKDPEINSMLMNRNYNQIEKKVQPILTPLIFGEVEEINFVIHALGKEFLVNEEFDESHNFCTILPQDENIKLRLYLDCIDRFRCFDFIR